MQKGLCQGSATYSNYFFRLSARNFRSRHLSKVSISTATVLSKHRNSAKSMRSFIEIIGAATPDASTSFQLFFDEARYLFDCGDGTQRACTEYAVRNMRLRQIFLTSLSAQSLGGLLGLSLTLADASKSSIAITGPAGISTFFSKAHSSFFMRPKFGLDLKDVDLEDKTEEGILVTSDEYVSVRAIPIRSRRNVVIDTAFGAHYDTLAYVGQLRDMTGKFNPQRAIELGVKRGYMFGLLQKGQTVTTEEGKQVTSKEVMSPSTPGPVFIVVPCSTLDHIRSVIQCRGLHPVEMGVLKEDGGELLRQCVIIHLAPRNVLEDKEYRQWCDSFGTNVTHIPVHSTVSPSQIVFASQAEMLAQLHYTVDKGIFPLPDGAFQDQEVPKESQTDAVYENRIGKWVQPEGRLRYNLCPVSSTGIDSSCVRPRFIERKSNHPAQPWKETAIMEEPEPAGKGMATPGFISSMPPRTVAVRFFGTGSAIPSKRRNVSGLMLDMFELGGVLLDCGEGTWGQMLRHFGTNEAKRKLCDLRVIFISHMHADHHLGLLNVLHQRTQAMKENEEYCKGPQLHIIGPYYLNQWLDEFQRLARVPLQQQLHPSRRSFRFVDASKLTDPQASEAKHFTEFFGLEVGCALVEHCPFAYGIAIKHQVQQWKVVYSGDTRPCEQLVRIGKNATLAIHEATFEHEMLGEARAKMHSTTTEALDVCAKKMGAWRTILTHFSQRYPKIPMLSDEMLTQFREARACVAFDLMCVDFSRLEELPKVTTALRDCFPDEYVVQEDESGKQAIAVNAS